MLHASLSHRERVKGLVHDFEERAFVILLLEDDGRDSSIGMKSWHDTDEVAVLRDGIQERHCRHHSRLQ